MPTASRRVLLRDKQGINAQFTPPFEQLAFSITDKFEADLPEIWPEPIAEVVAVLERFNIHDEVLENLPDIELIYLGL